MQVLIIEDELLLARQLKKILLEIDPAITVSAITHSVEESVQLLQQQPAPDLILMDVELADGQSFEIFQQVPVTAPVIFTTAYDEFALKAFKLNSIDYLLKPINKEELKTAIYKFRNTQYQSGIAENVELLFEEIQKLQQQASGYRERFLVKQGTKMVSVDVATVAYFFSEGGLSYLRTEQEQKFIVDYTLDELERMLPPRHFFRANRKYILNSRSVIAIRPWFNQKLIAEIKPAVEEQVVISRDRAPLFKSWLGE
ncbi:LytTR family DNA-binding domain-containing protein [Niabella sp.]|uniref:LytR/AlgR family response regulator transcription factor n=1 Tax=Niabella sp. TaxID=1962976 RepID=UPI00261B2A17|nr:LytTR family DNA-binding domain-containing protein [Niabella sp.]